MGSKKFLSHFIAVSSIVVLTATSFGVGPAATTAASKEPAVVNTVQETELVEITVPDQKALDDLVVNGYDLTGYVSDRNGSIEVHAVVTQAEVMVLKLRGYSVTTIQTAQEAKQNLRKRENKIRQQKDSIKVFRSDYFTNHSGTFLYIEAKSSAGSGVDMRVEWTDDRGEKQSATMTRKVDAGEYLYHHVLTKIESIPENVVITTDQGGKTETGLKEWIGEGTPSDDDYFSDFIDHYMTPTEVTERIEQLAEEFPELAEIVVLPNKTNGYRRKAQVTVGSNVNAAFVLTSKEWGHKGGNDITVDIQVPDQTNAELEITVEADHIVVNLGTDESAEPISTSNEVIAALNETADNLVSAAKYRDSNGDEVVQAESNIALTDNLSAPDEVSQDPWEVKAIRIGKVRDGSKPGVLGYSQEHAREWVTPLVSVETAERLLRNYHTDENTKKLVDNLDIFIVPSVNPDGGHYSFYDYNSQRKNMINHCGAENSDSAYRNQWGVDLNRNYEIGSVWNGWIGGSTNCLSGTYAGPEPFSEPEAQNLEWLAEQNSNIKFAMNIHAYGGYFMWSPGAYDSNRKTLPRPTAGEEAYYWQASEHILGEIKEHRGTVILPGRTGPIPDVLYSAGGNSADTLWYDHDIYAWNFEVGADLWDENRNRWVGVGFQPPFDEGHAEAMEFANGLIGLLEVAHENANDDINPVSTLIPEEGTYNKPTKIEFETSEPATVYYTLDGSRPTLESDTIQVAGTREGAESLTIGETATIKWFSKDASENMENGYNPDGEENNYNEAKIVIDYLPEGVSANGIKSLVERFEAEGEFTTDVAARALKTHMIAVDRFERQESAQKIVKHMQGFDVLLEQQKSSEVISGKAYRILKSYSDEMIQKWDSTID